jgi:hypothetical protein
MGVMEVKVRLVLKRMGPESWEEELLFTEMRWVGWG